MAKACAALADTGATVTAVASRSAAEIPHLLRQHDPERLVVLGGDGMIHHAVQAIAGSPVVLGILRGGTGNDIARALGIPRRPLPAANRAVEPATPLDLIRISNQSSTAYAVSVLTAGFSGLVTARANRIRWLGGQAKYTAATIGCLPNLKSFEVELIPGSGDLVMGSVPERACLIAFGNTRYFGGGMAICPTADPADGIMQVVTVEPVHAVHLAAVLPLAFAGQHLHSQKVHTTTARRMDLEIKPSWWADGEELAVTGPVSVEVITGALQIAGGP